MGDFGTAVRYLDWVKSRQATLLEAQSAPVPFDKYYGLQPSRALKKIPYTITLEPHALAEDFDYQYFPRLIFQYRVTAPRNLTLLNFKFINQLSVGAGIIAVRSIKNGIVSRYCLVNNFIDNYRLAELYFNQTIQKQFYLEFWATKKFSGPHGIFEEIKIITSLITNPSQPEDIEVPLLVDGPVDMLDYSWFIPFNLPEENNINTVFDVGPIPPVTPSFLTDEFGNFLVDEFGNKIIVT